MKKEYMMAGFTVFCWGTMAPVSKLLLSGLTNMEVLGYGSGIGALALLGAIIVSGEWRRWKEYSWKDLAKLALLGTEGYFLYSAFYYYGLRVLPAQAACILNYLWPIFTVMFSSVILKETFSRSALMAMLLSFLGVMVIMQVSPIKHIPGKSAELAGGYLSCILAAALYGFFNVMNKKQGKSQMINMFLYLGVSAVLALCCGWNEGLALPKTSQFPGLLWLGIFIDAAGYLLWAMALQETNTASIANFAYATPAISLFLSALILGEPVYLTSVIGLGLILGGFFLQMYLTPSRR